MSTREKRIEGYVNADSFTEKNHAKTSFTNYDFMNSVKATLIIYAPEPEIKLTESQFEELCRAWDGGVHFELYLKMKLFGDAKKS